MENHPSSESNNCKSGQEISTDGALIYTYISTRTCNENPEKKVCELLTKTFTCKPEHVLHDIKNVGKYNDIFCASYDRGSQTFQYLGNHLPKLRCQKGEMKNDLNWGHTYLEGPVNLTIIWHFFFLLDARELIHISVCNERKLL
jgi:hypothetical protein